MGWLVSSLIRLFVPLTVLRWPFWGSLTAVVADMVDVVIEDALAVTDFSLYNQIDKFWDTYFYVIQGWVVRKWKNRLAQMTAWGLLLYRLMGVIIYEFYPQRWLLLIFPNVFIWFFLVYVFGLVYLKRDLVKTKKSILFWLIVLAIPKMYQEYLFHVVQIPLYQTLRPFLFF